MKVEHTEHSEGTMIHYRLCSVYNKNDMKYSARF